MRTRNLVDERRVVSTDTEECLCTHCGKDLREQRKVGGVVENERPHARRERSAIHDPEMLLCLQRQGLEPVRR